MQERLQRVMATFVCGGLGGEVVGHGYKIAARVCGRQRFDRQSRYLIFVADLNKISPNE